MKKTAIMMLSCLTLSLFASCTKECNCTIYSGSDEPYSYTMTVDGSCSDLNQVVNGKANNNPTGGSATTKRVCVEI